MRMGRAHACAWFTRVNTQFMFQLTVPTAEHGIVQMLCGELE